MTTTITEKKTAEQLKDKIRACRANFKQSKTDEQEHRDEADSEARYQERLVNDEEDLLRELEREHGEEI